MRLMCAGHLLKGLGSFGESGRSEFLLFHRRPPLFDFERAAFVKLYVD